MEEIQKEPKLQENVEGKDDGELPGERVDNENRKFNEVVNSGEANSPHNKIISFDFLEGLTLAGPPIRIDQVSTMSQSQDSNMSFLVDFETRYSGTATAGRPTIPNPPSMGSNGPCLKVDKPSFQQECNKCNNNKILHGNTTSDKAKDLDKRVAKKECDVEVNRKESGAPELKGDLCSNRERRDFEEERGKNHIDAQGKLSSKHEETPDVARILDCGLFLAVDALWREWFGKCSVMGCMNGNSIENDIPEKDLRLLSVDNMEYLVRRLEKYKDAGVSEEEQTSNALDNEVKEKERAVEKPSNIVTKGVPHQAHFDSSDFCHGLVSLRSQHPLDSVHEGEKRRIATKKVAFDVSDTAEAATADVTSKQTYYTEKSDEGGPEEPIGSISVLARNTCREKRYLEQEHYILVGKRVKATKYKDSINDDRPFLEKLQHQLSMLARSIENIINNPCGQSLL